MEDNLMDDTLAQSPGPQSPGPETGEDLSDLAAVLGPKPDPLPAIVAKNSALQIQMARYRYALQIIAGLSCYPDPEEDPAAIALQALKLYDDHRQEDHK